MVFWGLGVSLLVRIKSGQVSTQDTVGLLALPEGVSFPFVSGCRFLSSNVHPASAD